MSVRLANGLHMPELGFGTFQASGQPLHQAVLKALDVGIQHIDTATIYRNEETIASAIKASGKRREDLFITSKLAPNETGPGQAAKAFERMLQRLDTSYLDLLLIHWPATSGLRLSSPQHRQNRAATWQAMQGLYQQQRVKAIGVSNFTPTHLEQLAQDCSEPQPMVNQVEVHPQFQNQELRDVCKRRRIAVVAYGSLGCGHLVKHPEVADLAKQINKSPAQVLLRWGLQSGCLVIPKSVTPSRVEEWGHGSLFDFELDGPAMSALGRLEDGTKYCWDPTDVA